MTSHVCVDYLAHEWSCSDLIKVHQELKKQRSKILFESVVNDLSPKELKRLETESRRQIRYENTVWRCMAKKCTTSLSASNGLIHPSEIDWQKESDITWLYGPLFVSSDHTMVKTKLNANTMSHLKPVLKKHLSPCHSHDQKDRLFKDLRYRYPRHWSKAASESGNQQSVRFHPDITEVCYLPETPTKEISEFLALNKTVRLAETREGEDQEFWSLLLQVGIYLKSKVSADYQEYPNITQLCISVTAFVYTTLFSLLIGDCESKHTLKQVS